MADSNNVTAPSINADGGDVDLQPLAQNLTTEDWKTAKTPRTSNSHSDEPVRKRRSTDSSPVRTPEKEVTDDERVGDMGSSSGTSDRDDPDAFHQQAEAGESQSEDQSKRLREIIKRVEADTILIKQALLKLYKKTLKDERVGDEASSSGTSDRDDPDAFHQQAEAEAEESQSKSPINKEQLREIIYGLGAEKISFIFSKLEQSRCILPQNEKLKDERVDEEASSSGKRELLLRIIDRTLTEDISHRNILSKLDETTAASEKFYMEIKRKLKDLHPAAEEEELQSEDHGNDARNDIMQQFHEFNKKRCAQFREIYHLLKLKEIGVTMPFILMDMLELSTLKIQQCVDTLVCKLK